MGGYVNTPYKLVINNTLVIALKEATQAVSLSWMRSCIHVDVKLMKGLKPKHIEWERTF